MSGFSSADELLFKQWAQQLNVNLEDGEITNKLEAYIVEVNKLKNDHEVQGDVVAEQGSHRACQSSKGVVYP